MNVDEIVRDTIERMPKRSGDLGSVMRRGRRRRFVLRSAATISALSVAAVALVGVNSLTSNGLGNDGSAVLESTGPTANDPAAPVSHLPRMIVDVPGFGVLSGSETFGGTWLVTFDGHEADLRVLPSEAVPMTADDLAADGLDVTDVEVAGMSGFVAEYDSGRSVLAWSGDDHSAVLDYIAGGTPEATRIAQHVTYVDEGTWRALLPANLILPEERPQAVRDILAGVALPPALTTEDLTGRNSYLANAIMSEPDLIVTVTAELSCEWIRTWVHATNTGEKERASQAVEAMRHSHRWPALDRPGLENWKSIITGYADAIANDGTVGGTPVANSYQSLGCSRYENPTPTIEPGDSAVTTTIP